MAEAGQAGRFHWLGGGSGAGLGALWGSGALCDPMGSLSEGMNPGLGPAEGVRSAKVGAARLPFLAVTCGHDMRAQARRGMMLGDGTDNTRRRARGQMTAGVGRGLGRGGCDIACGVRRSTVPSANQRRPNANNSGQHGLSSRARDPA